MDLCRYRFFLSSTQVLNWPDWKMGVEWGWFWEYLHFFPAAYKPEEKRQGEWISFSVPASKLYQNGPWFEWVSKVRPGCMCVCESKRKSARESSHSPPICSLSFLSYSLSLSLSLSCSVCVFQCLSHFAHYCLPDLTLFFCTLLSFSLRWTAGRSRQK